MGALSHFDISNNGLYVAGAKAITEGLKGNQVMTELNISGNDMGRTSMYGSYDVSGVAALADVIPGMRALLSLDMSKNLLCNREAGKVLSQMLAVNTVLKKLGVSNNIGFGARDSPGFAQELSAGIKDNGAMTSLNLGSNNLRVEGAKIIAAVLPKCT